MRLAIAIFAIASCTASASAPPSPPPEEARLEAEANASADRDSESAGTTTPAITAPEAPPGSRLGLELDQSRQRVAAGRWALVVKVPGESYVTVGLRGRQDALRRFEIVPPRNLRRLRPEVYEEDGRLPVFVSFETPVGEHEVVVVVDVDAPAEIFRTSAPHASAKSESPPLVGLPFPIESRAGYFLQYPHRYQFVRADVALALRQAYHQTRVRFGSGAFGIGDASQWNGIKPASDIGHPRHISHQGGRDIDIALPGEKGLWTIDRRCEGVLVDRQVLKCSPGTVRNFDAKRLAYFLALLIDGPTPGGRYVANPKHRTGPVVEVEAIFTDQAYIEEVRRALDELRDRRWIHDEAYGALGEEGLLRPSSWHTDHVHVRFVGARGQVPELLAFDAEIPQGEQGAAVPEIVSGPQ